MSLSARRAWIEIKRQTYHRYKNKVALRKESVDRNYIIKITRNTPAASLSARRAWIEIAMTSQISVTTVSLSARRAWIEIVSQSYGRIAM